MYTKTIRNLTYEICDDYAVVWKCDKNATSVVIAETIEGKPVTEIGDWTFYECESLKNIIIPHSVIEIGKCAFARCTSLKEITIPDNIEQIDENAFMNCSNIQKVKFSQALANRTDSKKIFEQMVNAGLCTYEVIFQEPVL